VRAVSSPKFRLKGVRVINFCPICMRPLLDADTIKLIARAVVEMEGLELYEFLNWMLRPRGVEMFGIFIPKDEEVAKEVDYRKVFYPICRECYKKYFEDRSQEEIEKIAKEIENRLIELKKYATRIYD